MMMRKKADIEKRPPPHLPTPIALSTSQKWSRPAVPPPAPTKPHTYTHTYTAPPPPPPITHAHAHSYKQLTQTEELQT